MRHFSAKNLIQIHRRLTNWSTVKLGDKELFGHPKIVPYPYEINWPLVTENGSLTPISSLSKRSLSPSLTVQILTFSNQKIIFIEELNHISLMQNRNWYFVVRGNLPRMVPCVFSENHQLLHHLRTTRYLKNVGQNLKFRPQWESKRQEGGKITNANRVTKIRFFYLSSLLAPVKKNLSDTPTFSFSAKRISMLDYLSQGAGRQSAGCINIQKVRWSIVEKDNNFHLNYLLWMTKWVYNVYE